MAQDQVERIARGNTLACLDFNRRMYREAGNLECFALFDEAFNLRLELIAEDEVEVGVFQ